MPTSATDYLSTVSYPPEPRNYKVNRSYWILCYAIDSARSFYKIFNDTRRNRNARGAATDNEQDLLRAMLVFSTAGLDSMIKQLIEATLPLVIASDTNAENKFRQFVKKSLLKNGVIDSEVFVSAILAEDATKELINFLKRNLTSGSLQSIEELSRAASYFNISRQEIINNEQLLKEIFDARNKISHEMDIDFTPNNRNRRQRSLDNMRNYVLEIFRIAETFLTEVDKKLNPNHIVE